MIFALSACTNNNEIPQTYNIIYKGNGNTSGVAPIDSNKYESGSSAKVLNQSSLIKSGSSFIGWNTSPDGNGLDYYVDSIIEVHDSDLVLYAKWTINPTYIITYESNGATSGNIPVDDNLYESESSVVVLGQGDLERNGYTFIGWNTRQDGEGFDYIVNSTISIINSNIVLYAKWVLKPTFGITYKDNGSTSGTVPLDDTRYESGTVVQILNQGSLVKIGWSFIGWNTSPDGDKNNYPAGSSITIDDSDIILYAIWYQNVSDSIISVGSGVFSESFSIEITNSTIGATLYYTLDGSDPTEKSDIVNGSIVIAQPLIIKIRGYKENWAPSEIVSAEYIGAYTIKYHYDGILSGSINCDKTFMKNNTFEFKNDYNSIQGPEVALNCNFTTYKRIIGWSLESDLSGNIYTQYGLNKSLVFVDRDIDLYAVWSIIGATGPAGGIVFYDNQTPTNEGWQYIECAPDNTEWIDVRWGGAGTYINQLSEELGGGIKNTAIINSSFDGFETNTAAQLCKTLIYSGYNDWQLPNNAEAKILYNNLNPMGYGNISQNGYWSSSQYDAWAAWPFGYGYGDNDQYSKNSPMRVRAIRFF